MFRVSVFGAGRRDVARRRRRDRSARGTRRKARLARPSAAAGRLGECPAALAEGLRRHRRCSVTDARRGVGRTRRPGVAPGLFG
jgi:hypothetical protein